LHGPLAPPPQQSVRDHAALATVHWVQAPLPPKKSETLALTAAQHQFVCVCDCMVKVRLAVVELAGVAARIEVVGGAGETEMRKLGSLGMGHQSILKNGEKQE
jgi:hypothetical protein